jgi:azobenzene reductase
MDDPLKILLIGGSVRQPSFTLTLQEEVRKALDRLGAETASWSLRESTLPIADPDFHGDPTRHTDETVRRLVTIADSCDAFVLASPIYHNSYSGVLKNALDHLSIAQFHYKPVGLTSHGGHRSPQAVDHLRIVVRGLLGVAIPTQVCTSETDYEASGGGYLLRSEDILRRIERFAGELLVFAGLLRDARR